MTIHRTAIWTMGLALLLTGCSSGPPEMLLQRLDPKAPAAAGLPALPGPGEPAPLDQRPPFGLYAEYPSADTLQRVAQGLSSPDGRYRAALTEQGAWVTRVDGAWLWQVKLPAPPPPAPPPPAPGKPDPKPATPPAPAKAPTAVSVAWTPRNTLLLRTDNGLWFEAGAERASVTELPLALHDKESLLFSPDGKQVLYYINGKNGQELWAANADGSKPQYLGVNVIGWWDQANKPVVQRQESVSPGQLNPGQDPYYIGPLPR